MSHATEVAAAPDEMILQVGENSHALYFRVGTKNTVLWLPGYQLYACLSCRSNVCPHTERVRAYRETRSAP